MPQLKADGHMVEQAEGDADGIIANTALQLARSGTSVTVSANDTDVIAMLLYHWEDSMSQILVRSELKQKGHIVYKQLDIGMASSLLKPEIKHLILFMHAFSGCNTTYSIYEKGKGSIVKLIEKSSDAQNISRIFMNDAASKEDIGEAGQQIFVLLYGGKMGDDIASICYQNHMKIVATASTLNPSKLPPTKRAAFFHSLRVRLQVRIKF